MVNFAAFDLGISRPAARGAAVAAQRNENELDRLASIRDAQTRELLPGAVAGDQDALSQLAGLNLDAAAKVQEFQDKRKASSRDDVEFQQEQSAQSLARIAATPPDQQAEVYAEERERLIEGGAKPESLPEQFDASFVESSISAAQQAGFLKTERPIEIFDPTSPTGSRLVSPGQATGQPGKANRGVRVTTNADGTTTVETNAATSDLTKPTRTALEKKQVQTGDQLARVKDIEGSFKPEFLEVGTKFNAAFTAGKEKLGFEIDDEDRKLLTELSTFKRRTINNINLLLNELSGAAVSPEEAERLRSSMPDAGDGVFDGDSPTVFKAKMDDVLAQLKLSFMRLEFARKQGLDALTISLSEMEQRIEDRGQELLDRLSGERPDLPRDALILDIDQRLLNEFGDFR